MNVLLWVLFGALVGWIGSFLAFLQKPREVALMTIYGVVGGVTGGLLANIICNESINTFNIYSVLSAALGAAFITWASRVFVHHDHNK